MMELKAHRQFKVMMDICEKEYPELYIKLLGTDEDITEFHHHLWSLPFYQKMTEQSKGINTTKYLYLSDKNCSSTTLFYLYELSYTKFSLKGTHSIEKKIIDIDEHPKKFKKGLSTVLGTGLANNVPSEIWNYTILL